MINTATTDRKVNDDNIREHKSSIMNRNFYIR
nr:MAG TPA: hypothetical protein [Caudoviricetes sp.]